MDSNSKKSKEESSSDKNKNDDWVRPRELLNGQLASTGSNETEQDEIEKQTGDVNSGEDILDTNQPPGKFTKFKHWYLAHKKISIPATLAVLVFLSLVIPASRYAIAAIYISHDIQILVSDSETGSPVSGASVKVGSHDAVVTNGTGYATVNSVKPGSTSVEINKKYYDNLTTNITVGVLAPESAINATLKANGRAAKIKVVDLISKGVLVDASIKVADTEVITDEKGEALVVLPVGQSSHEAMLHKEGYNESKGTLKVSDTGIEQNNYEMTPSGQVYFLSNRNGQIDVMKSDLDGSNTKVVLAGTGQEDENNTELIASPGWNYLALLARREGKSAKVYIITTSDGKLSTVDDSSGNFTLAGWLGSHLVYSLKRSDVKAWQTGSAKLKSYDAATGRTTTLNQTSGEGDVNSNAFEYYKFVYLASDEVVYAKGWTSESDSEPDYNGKRESLSSILPDGQNPKVATEYDASTKVADYSPHAPNSIYIQVNTLGTDEYEYFDFSVGSTPTATNLNFDQFYRSYPVYYQSADGNRTLWTEQRDGKNTILTGDRDGSQETIVSVLDGEFSFGWFSENYILLSQSGSLSIISRENASKPIKINDYFGGSFYAKNGYWFVY